jgi:hypothetical protein
MKDELSPKKRRALFGSFLLGSLVIAFYSAVLLLHVPSGAPSARSPRAKPPLRPASLPLEPVAGTSSRSAG